MNWLSFDQLGKNKEHSDRKKRGEKEEMSVGSRVPI